MKLHIDDVNDKKLYLYNDSKKKYEWIQCENTNSLELTTAGEYRFVKQKIKQDMVFYHYIAIGCGIMGGLILIMFYIGVKKDIGFGRKSKLIKGFWD